MVMRETVITVCDRCDNERGQEVDGAVIRTVGGLTFELCDKCRAIVDQFDAFARKYAVKSSPPARSVTKPKKPKPPTKKVVWVRRAECLVPGCGAVVHWRAKGLHASNMHGKKMVDVQWRDFESAEDK